MGERLVLPCNDQSLAPLVEISPLLKFDARGRVRASDKIEVPLDEFGIPRRVELMRQVLATLETAHHWTGGYDVHHLAWERDNYRHIILDGELIGASYRGCSSLKIIIPRQLHNYIHLVSEMPPVPEIEIMRQYALEHNQVYRLHDTISLDSYVAFPELDRLPHEAKEELRLQSFQRKLVDMEDGKLNVMPDRAELLDLDLKAARQTLRAIARTQGFSNKRSSQRSFFSLAA